MESSYGGMDEQVFNYRHGSRKNYGKQVRPIRSTSSYNSRESEVESQGEPITDWTSQLIRVRSRWLVKTHPELGKSFLGNRDLYALAEKYVKDDYEISPRTGRRIIYRALVELIGVKELEGIEEDPMIKSKDFSWNTPGEVEVEKPRRGRGKRKAKELEIVCA